MKIQPKGNKVLVEVIDKSNFDDTTSSGIIVTAKETDSHDSALLLGRVIVIGTKEVDYQGITREPDVSVETQVYFNRYNAYKVYSKGLTDYYLVSCIDIWGVVDN